MNVTPHGIALLPLQARACALALAASLWSAGCADGGGDPLPTPAAASDGSTATDAVATNRYSDELILGKVYALAPSVPEGFYQDPAGQLSVSFSLRHLRDADRGGAAVHDLCSDDMATAIAWSQGAAPDWPVITVRDTDLYVEITHQRTDLPDWWALQRVYRCAVFNSTLADPLATSGFVGRLGAQVAGPDMLKRVAEYLWQFSALSNPGSAVLGARAGTVGQDGWHYTLELARRVPSQAVGACDRIERMDWHYELAADGAVHRRLLPIRSFAGRLDNGTALPCPGT